MADQEIPQRPFGRTFATLGALYLVAIAALLAAAGVGWAPPALVPAPMAWLLAGGGLLTLGIIVPIGLFTIHRYTRAAAASVEEVQHDMHAELHAAHDSSLDQIERSRRLNEVMHGTDRKEFSIMARRIDELGTAIQDRALAADLQSLRDITANRHEALETMQEAHWVDHARSHAVAEETGTTQQAEIEDTLAQVAERLHSLHDAHTSLAKRVAGAEETRTATMEELNDAIKAIRLSQQQERDDMDARLAAWRAPDDQLKVWAERTTDYTDHALARFRHKMQHQLDQFESRSLADIGEASRHTHDDAAMLAEDIARRRLEDAMASQREQMDGFKAEMEEQFATFLAGQLAQRTEAEARLAAIGATRGVKVQSNDAYSLTSHAPFGRIYPVTDIEGIGNKTAYTLQRMGILDTEHLWHADVKELAEQLDITPRQVRQWQSQAELMAIDGIATQWGEILAASGVMSIGHLANLHGRELLELIQAHGHAYRTRLHKGAINAAKAEEIIQMARDHSPEAAIHV